MEIWKVSLKALKVFWFFLMKIHYKKIPCLPLFLQFRGQKKSWCVYYQLLLSISSCYKQTMQKRWFISPNNSWFWSTPSPTPLESCICLTLTFLGVRALVDFAFFPLFLFTVDFLPFFSGVGERIVSDLPLAPRFLARSSGWILGRTPPLAIVTPFSNCKEKQRKGTRYRFS